MSQTAAGETPGARAATLADATAATDEAAATRVVRGYFGFQFFFGLLFWLPVFYEYQKRCGLSDPEIFGIQSLYYVAFCLLEIPTGMLADQLGYRRCMRAGAAVLVGANLLPILAPGYGGFLAHFLGIALARSFVSGASSAYLYNFLQTRGTPESYKDVEGRARALGLAGKVAGWSAVGGLMEWHQTLPYWLTVAAALVSLGFAWALPDVAPPPAEPGSDERILARVRRALVLLRGTPLLTLAILQGVAVFVLARICQVNLFQPILESRGLPVASYGMVMAMMTAFEAVGAARPGMLRRWLDDAAAIFLLTGVLAVAMVLIPTTGSMGTVALLGIFAFAAGQLFPIQKQLMNDAIPDSRYRATFLSLESIVDRAVNAGLAAMIGGFLARGQLALYLRGAGLATVVLMALLYGFRARVLAGAAGPPEEPPPEAPPAAAAGA